ncbi:MAG TPA: chlorite dismutase family protein [Acidimicrobiales bacterium]|nr:chlorite dismutase family protein [Acidimicrobiales bacterium]
MTADPFVPEDSPVSPLSPKTGWGVLHLFCKPRAGVKARPLLDAIDAARKDDCQVVTAAMLGHKADVCVLALGPDLRRLRRLQTELQAGGLDVVDSYVSLTEVSEYAAGVPEEMKQARLYPTLPPEGMPAICFYPMSKRRAPGAENWYALSFDERVALMRGHGAAGREFRGRVLQLVTGSTGLDDWEWGVTLFGVHPDDLKDCVYAMRFDEASTRYAEFGPFYTGIVGGAGDVLGGVGVR